MPESQFFSLKHLVVVTVAVLISLPVVVRAHETGNERFPTFAWAPITDDDWNPDLSWVEGPCDAIMLFERVIDDESILYYGALNRRVYQRTRILTEQGRQNTDVSFTYDPGTDNLIELQARTILPDGQEFYLSKEEILALARPVDGGGHAKQVTFSFPHADSNCIVEYNFGINQEKIGSYFTYRDYQVQKGFPLLIGEYTWYPAEPYGPDQTYRNLGQPYYVWNGPYPEIIATTENLWGTDFLRQVVHHVPGWHEEDMALPEEMTHLQIWRYYSMEAPGSVLRGIARQYRSPEPDSYNFGKDDRKEIDKAVEPFRQLGEKDRIVRAVYTWLQDSVVNTSYCKKPPAWFVQTHGRRVRKFKDLDHLRDVLKNNYGDWRDIDCLFYRMLQALHIEALPVLVAGRDEHVYNPEAGFFQFERFLVAVGDSTSGYRYYCPGEYAMPFGELNGMVQDIDALLCDQEAHTVHIPASPPERNEAIRTFRLSLAEDGRVSGLLEEHHNGHKGRLCRVFGISDHPEKSRSSLQDSLANTLPGVAATLKDLDMTAPFGDPVVMSYTLEYPAPAETGWGTTWLTPLALAPDTASLFTAPKRYGEISFECAYHAIDSIYLKLPSGSRIRSLPNDTTVTTGAGSCCVKFVQYDGIVVAVRDFTLNRPRFPVEEYGEVQALFAARSDLARTRVELQPIE